MRYLVNGIIFDLDGVLVDSMPAHYKAWEIAFREVVVAISGMFTILIVLYEIVYFTKSKNIF
jgi:beta-phosphoglucomutase-like phosphatase (HAD superfamily)